MFYNVLFKIVQFTNDIVHAVNHFSQLRNVGSFAHSIQEEKKKKKKRSIVYPNHKKEKRKSFAIHSFLR